MDKPRTENETKESREFCKAYGCDYGDNDQNSPEFGLDFNYITNIRILQQSEIAIVR